MKRLLAMILCIYLFYIPSVYAHTDPPNMKLTIEPDMPDVGEVTTLSMQLIGSLTGYPTIGAKGKIVLTSEKGIKIELPFQEGNKPGLYGIEFQLPEYGMWDMRVDIEHQAELDFRHYMVHVMKPVPGYHNVLKDVTLLKMDKNAQGQLIPPRLLLEGFVLLIIILLVIVSQIKRKRVNVYQNRKGVVS